MKKMVILLIFFSIKMLVLLDKKKIIKYLYNLLNDAYNL